MSTLIAYNLIKYRKINNLTQQQLSNKVKIISKPAIALYESNRRTPDYDIQEKLCEILNISINILNGQNEIDLFSKQIRKYLIEYNVSSNQFQYIYRQLINFFNDKNCRLSREFNTNTIKNFNIFLKNSYKDIKKYLNNDFSNDENKNELLKCFDYILNSFICLNLLVRREKTYNINEIITEKYISDNKTINEEFIKVFIELKPTYIKILDTLKEIDIFTNSNIPMYFINAKKVSDYIFPIQSSSNNQAILTAIKVNDDFMSPKFEKNDIVIIKQYEPYKTGDFVVVSNQEQNLLIGKLKLEDNMIILQPLNINYSPIVLNAKDCKVLGIIVEVRYAN